MTQEEEEEKRGGGHVKCGSEWGKVCRVNGILRWHHHQQQEVAMTHLIEADSELNFFSLVAISCLPFVQSLWTLSVNENGLLQRAHWRPIFLLFCLSNTIFFLKMGYPGLFFIYFRSFQRNNTILQQIKVKKCLSSIWHHDSNPQPFQIK